MPEETEIVCLPFKFCTGGFLNSVYTKVILAVSYHTDINLRFGMEGVAWPAEPTPVLGIPTQYQYSIGMGSGTEMVNLDLNNYIALI